MSRVVLITKALYGCAIAKEPLTRKKSSFKVYISNTSGIQIGITILSLISQGVCDSALNVNNPDAIGTHSDVFNVAYSWKEGTSQLAMYKELPTNNNLPPPGTQLYIIEVQIDFDKQRINNYTEEMNDRLPPGSQTSMKKLIIHFFNAFRRLSFTSKKLILQ